MERTQREQCSVFCRQQVRDARSARAPETIAARHANTLRTRPLVGFVGSACGQQPACQERGGGLDPQAPLSQAFRDAVSAEISDFLSEQSSVLDSMGPELVPLHLMASQMLCGGKRMRPAFCVWGYVAAAGNPSDEDLKPLLTAAGSLDVLHVSALIHDDLMVPPTCGAAGRPLHRQFEALHANAGWLGDSAAFGRAGAILLGDLLLMWSAQMLLRRRRPVRSGASAPDRRGDADRGHLRSIPGHGGAGPPAGSGLRRSGAEAHYRTGIGRRQPSRGVQGRAIYRAAAPARSAPQSVAATTSCTSPSALTAHRWVRPSSSGMTCWVSSGIRR